MRPLDDQIGHFRRQHHPGKDGGLALAHPGGDEAVGELHQEDDARRDEPLPELGRVDDQYAPISYVQGVGEVEDLEIDTIQDFLCKLSMKLLGTSVKPLHR